MHKKHKNNACILLFSGGVDSALLANTHLKRIKYLFHFEYNHPSKNQEKQAVINIYKILKKKNPNLELHIYKLDIQAHSLSIGPGLTSPRIVPHRNIIMISIAANFGHQFGIKCIMFGANLNDFNDYVDCRPTYIKSLERLLHIQIEAPLLSTNKTSIKKELSSYDETKNITWSCYQPIKNAPCTTCNSCHENK